MELPLTCHLNHNKPYFLLQIAVALVFVAGTAADLSTISYRSQFGSIATPAQIVAQPKWLGPLASPTVLPNGFLAETPEVSALRTQHSAEVARAAAASAPIGGSFLADSPVVSRFSSPVASPSLPPVATPSFGVPSAGIQFQRVQPQWRGPIATPTVLPNGFLTETPEVSALRTQHSAEVARAAAASTPIGGTILADAPVVPRFSAPVASPSLPPVATPSFGVPSAGIQFQRVQPQWRGPIATPTVLPSGYLADTPEVSALRTQHSAEVARAAAASTPQGPISSPDARFYNQNRFF